MRRGGCGGSEGPITVGRAYDSSCQMQEFSKRWPLTCNASQTHLVAAVRSASCFLFHSCPNDFPNSTIASAISCSAWVTFPIIRNILSFVSLPSSLPSATTPTCPNVQVSIMGGMIVIMGTRMTGEFVRSREALLTGRVCASKWLFASVRPDVPCLVFSRVKDEHWLA